MNLTGNKYSIIAIIVALALLSTSIAGYYYAKPQFNNTQKTITATIIEYSTSNSTLTATTTVINKSVSTTTKLITSVHNSTSTLTQTQTQTVTSTITSIGGNYFQLSGYATVSGGYGQCGGAFEPLLINISSSDHSYSSLLSGPWNITNANTGFIESSPYSMIVTRGSYDVTIMLAYTPCEVQGFSLYACPAGNVTIVSNTEDSFTC